MRESLTRQENKKDTEGMRRCQCRRRERTVVEMMRQGWRKMRRVRMELDKGRETFNSGLDRADFQIADKSTCTLALTCKSPQR